MSPSMHNKVTPVAVHLLYCNAMSDWIMLEICCNIHVFDITNYVTFGLVTCSYMQAAAQQNFNGKQVQKCVIEIIIFKVFIWGGLS